MRHVAYMNGACRIYKWVMSHIWMRHVAYINESYRTYEWDMSHVWLRHVTFMNESWCIYQSGIICATWLTHMCDMTHSYVWHDSFICVTNESWCIYQSGMSPKLMSQVARMYESCRKYECAMSHVWMSHLTRIHESWCMINQSSRIYE